MDEVTLYDPLHGLPVTTTAAAEVVRLRAAGYTDTEPFRPDEHTVEEVQRHLAEDPADAPRVVAVEKAGKRRATIVGHPPEDAPDASPSDTGTGTASD